MNDPIHSNPPPQPVAASASASDSNPERKTLRVFVSSPDDLGEERALVQDLVKRLAVEYQRHFRLTEVIWEETALSAAQDFQEGIIEPASCDIVIVMLWSKLGSVIKSPEYEGMTGTEWEFHNAIRRAETDGKPVVLMYRKTAPKAGNLMDQQVIDQAREDARRLEAFFAAEVLGKKRAFRVFDNKDRLAQMLEQHLRSELNQYRVAESAGYWEGSPFRGLKSFEYEHRSIYFGRDQAKRQLLHQLAQQVEAGVAFIMVSAMSGSGKSSLVKAGLLPMLESYKAIGDVVLAPWTVMRPNDASTDPVLGLAKALLRPKGMAAAAIDDEIDLDWVTEALRNSPGLLKPFLQSALSSMAEGGEARLVVVVDQFEELFSNQHFPQQAREQFINALEALARSGLVWVIATMRSDFLHQVEPFPTLVGLMSGNGQYHLARPREDELLQMIREPARIAGLSFEQGTTEGLDQRLMEDAARDLGSLPLLEFTLDALYERRDGTMLTFAAYDAIGGIEGAVADRAERVFLDLPQAAQGSFEHVFRMLVTVDPESRGVSSRRALRRQLEDAPGALQLIEAFVDGHLLVSDVGQDDEAVVWVAHEALLRVWPRLSNWVEDNIADLRARAHLLERASQWDREGRNNDFLLAEGRPYVEAADLVKRFGAQLDPLERLFVQRSEQHIRATRWRLIGLLTFLGALLGLIVLATLAFTNAKRNFQDGNLENASGELTRGNVALSVFLAVNSDLLPDSATEVLSRAFSNEYLRAMVNQRDEQSEGAGFVAGNGYQAGFSVSGRWVISLPGDGRAGLWRLDEQPANYTGPVALLGGADVAEAEAEANSATNNEVAGAGLVAAMFSHQDARVLLLSNRCVRIVGEDRLNQAMRDGQPVVPHPERCEAVTGSGAWALDLGAGSVAQDLDGLRLARWGRDGRQLAMVRRNGAADTDSAGWMLLLVDTSVDGNGEDGKGASIRYPLPGEVRSLEIAPDGRHVAVATRDGHLCVAATGAAQSGMDCQLITANRPVNRLAFNPQSTRLAAVSADQMLRLFSLGKGKPACMGVLGSEMSGAPGGKGSWVNAGSGVDCSKASLRNLVHEGAIRAVAFSPDGNSLATGGDDRRVVIWRIDGKKVRWAILGSHDQTINGALFAPQGLPDRLVTTSIDHTARLWDTRTGEQLMVFGHDGPVTQARFVEDDGKASGTARGKGIGLMTVSSDHTARLWQIEAIKPIAYPLEGHQNHVWHVGFRERPAADEAADANTAAEDAKIETVELVTTSYDGNARLWTLQVNKPSDEAQGFRYLRERIRDARVTKFAAGGATDPVRYATFANTSDQLVTTTRHGHIDIWNLQGEHQCALAVGGSGSPAALLPIAGFSPDDQHLFSAQTDRGAQRWDLSACKASESPLVASQEQGQEQDQDQPPGQDKQQQQARSAMACVAPQCQAFALAGKVTAATSQVADEDGRWLLAVGFADGRVSALDPDDPATPLCISKQPHQGKVVDIHYSPDHTRLLTASSDGTAALWDARDCRQLTRYGGANGHEQSLYTARFSPDGERIVTASQDRSARVWSQDGTLLKRLIGHLDRVYHASFSPDGRWVLTASRDGTARLWDSMAEGDTLSAVVELQGNGSGISSAAFSPDGRYVATGYWDPGADLWDVLNGDVENGLTLTMPDYARRFVELNRLQQWQVRSVPRELPWWEEVSRAVWGEAQ